MSKENKKSPDEKLDSTAVLVDQFSPKPNFSSERTKSVFNEVSKLVGGAEATSVAQARIKELEIERDHLRTELDKSVLKFEDVQRQFTQLKDMSQDGNHKHRNKIEILEDEKTILRDRLSAKDKEIQQLKKQNEELEFRFRSDLQKIRIKEREYENKNIILKAENHAISKTKDEMIIDLQNKIGQLEYEINQFKHLLSEKRNDNTELKDRQARTVKALRVALNILEDDVVELKGKKASGE
jgi:chromosome segregation ATPase